MPSLPAFPSPEFRRSRARACVAAAQIDVATTQLCPLGRQAMIGLARAELHRGTSIEQLRRGTSFGVAVKPLHNFRGLAPLQLP